MEHKTKDNKTLAEDSRSHHDRLLREERLIIEKHNESIADEDPEGEFMESLHVKYTHIIYTPVYIYSFFFGGRGVFPLAVPTPELSAIVKRNG